MSSDINTLAELTNLRAKVAELTAKLEAAERLLDEWRNSFVAYKLGIDRPAPNDPTLTRILEVEKELIDQREAVRVLAAECEDMRDREPIGPRTNPGIISCREAVNANPIAAAAVNPQVKP